MTGYFQIQTLKFVCFFYWFLNFSCSTYPLRHRLYSRLTALRHFINLILFFIIIFISIGSIDPES